MLLFAVHKLQDVHCSLTLLNEEPGGLHWLRLTAAFRGMRFALEHWLYH